MKIFFIYPSLDSQLGFNYGVACMAAILKRAGHRVSFWQICEELAPPPTEQEFLDRLEQEAPDLLAFSVVTNQWPYTQQLAGWARKRFSKPLVLGGIHALAEVEAILATGLFDYVLRGECEEAFLDFVDKLQQGLPLNTAGNMAWRENGTIHINPMRALPDITQLPFKDYDVMDFQKMIDAKKGWVGLMASRGCPFSCTYCFNHQMVDAYKHDLQCGFKQLNYIRRHSVGQIIDEINYLLKNYRNITTFIFDDDLFTIDTDFVTEFCRAYKKTCSLPFVVNAHVRYFDQACVRELAAAGCTIVKFGVESGSPSIRRQILNRHMTNEAIIEAINMVQQYGMHSSVFLIIGFPHETRENVFETIELMGQCKPGRFRWTYFFPFPGTKAQQISQEGGFINEQKMQQAHNFTDQTCLEFNPALDLFLKKAGKIMPWFVNAFSDLPVADYYRQETDRILEMDENDWLDLSPNILEKDKAISEKFSRQNLSHYAVKYNRFMGVISDYFLNE